MAENPGDDVGATLAAHAPAPVGANARNTRAEMTERSTPRTAPVDYLVVVSGADKANFSGEIVSELTALIEQQHHPGA